MTDHAGRTVLVTGGTKGIGAGIAAALRAAGANGAARAGRHPRAPCVADGGDPAVRVNTVIVGLADAGAPGQAEHCGGPAALAAINHPIPAGRMATPGDVARGCLFLAADP